MKTSNVASDETLAKINTFSFQCVGIYEIISTWADYTECQSGKNSNMIFCIKTAVWSEKNCMSTSRLNARQKDIYLYTRG